MLGSWQGSAKPGDKVLVSGLAGSLTGGTVAFLTRGRANVIPGTIMYSLLGLSGQGVYNYADARHTRWEMGGTGEGNESSFWRKLADMKWSPVKVLSDDEYRDLLEGKLQRVNAEIALTDENIKKLAEKSRPSAEKNI
ncbi:MAG: hypothetical protein M1833_006854 [Piccolia ochrophora]|nr:MAG: hypothetical protein M1833_006854 [Piccolia ochrophora]